MQFRLLRLIAVSMFLAFTITSVHAQKRSKKHPVHTVKHVTVSPVQVTGPVDMSRPTPSVPIPQQSSLTPELRKTKKVVIVPAPPPPPGRDPVPPYPKR